MDSLKEDKLMKLPVHEVAELLDVPEATIMRWVRQGKIPARIDNGQVFLFDKDLRRWAETHNFLIKERKKYRPIDEDESNITLFEAMQRGGIFFGVAGDSVEAVLREALNLVPLPGEINLEELIERLLQREELASTGIGEGVAIPHPRYPIENLSEKALVTTCFLKNEIDFNSVDKKPVFVIFLMLSSHTKIHLKLLSRLSLCLRDKAFLSVLRKSRSAEAILEKVKELERPL